MEAPSGITKLAMFSLVKGNTLELPSPTLLETLEKHFEGWISCCENPKVKGDMEI